MNISVNRMESIPLLASESLKKTNLELDNQRKNQKIESLSTRLDILAKSLFCLGFPCLFEQTQVTVFRQEDVIVSRWGIITDILREPGDYCLNPIGLKIKRVDMSYCYSSIAHTVNDVNGQSLDINAQFQYRVVDSLTATYKVHDYKIFLKTSAQSILFKVCAQYPVDDALESKTCLKYESNEINNALKTHLHEIVKVIGIEIDFFRLTGIRYKKKFSAQQKAAAYVEGRKAIAKGAASILHEMLNSLENHQIIPNAKQTDELVHDLISIICKPNMPLNLYNKPSALPICLTTQRL